MKSFKIGDLQIPVPIVQGGMGIGISLSGLASAVASAGGIGTIATVGVGLIYGTHEKSFKQNNIDDVLYEIRKARTLTKGVLAANIMSVNYCIADALLSAYYGEFDSGFAFSGANGHKIKSITSVKEVFHRFISDYKKK